jgi:hypothetical protein
MALVLASPTTLYASAARTASPTTHTPFRRNAQTRGFLIQIDVTAASSTPSVVFTLQDLTADVWTTVLASAAVTGVGTTNLVVHPDAADRANVSEVDQTLEVWRVIAVHGDADSITYSVKVWPLY